MPSFYSPGSRGTVAGVPEDEFDPESACQELYNAMSGLGTTEKVIIRVIVMHNLEQRQVIRSKYKTMYGKDLREELHDELGGGFSRAIYGLMTDPEEFLVELIHEAIEGLGTDERKLVSLLCFRSNAEIQEMKEYYKNKYGKDMEEDVADDLSGEFRTMMISLLNGDRNEDDEIDQDKVKADAQALYDAGPAELGTREEVFNAIFNCRNPAHMREVFDQYEDISGGTAIEDTIESEFSGSTKVAYLAMIKCFRNLVAYNAQRLYDATSGMGTDDGTLISIIVTRSEIDLLDIAEFFEGKYEKRLADVVGSETSGDLRTLLTGILGEPVPE